MVSNHIYVYMYILGLCDVLMKTNCSIYALYIYIHPCKYTSLSYLCAYSRRYRVQVYTTHTGTERAQTPPIPSALPVRSPRSGGGGASRGSQSEPRAAGATREAGVRAWSLEGARPALPGPSRRRQAPQRKMAAYLHSAPARPMGARPPAPRRGQLRRRPRWRRRGPGRAGAGSRCGRARRGPRPPAPPGEAGGLSLPGCPAPCLVSLGGGGEARSA